MPEGIDPSRTTTVLRMQIQPLHGSRGSQQDAQLQLCVPSMPIAVRDYRPDRMPSRALVNSPSERGHGLSVVAAISANWGIIPVPGGKIIWAVLPLTGPATYSHVIRTACGCQKVG